MFHEVWIKCLIHGVSLHGVSILLSHLLRLHPSTREGAAGTRSGAEGVLISCNVRGPWPLSAEIAVGQTLQEPMFSHTDVKLMAHFDNNDIPFGIFHGGGQYKASHAARGLQLNGFQPLSSAPEVPFNMLLLSPESKHSLPLGKVGIA